MKNRSANTRFCKVGRTIELVGYINVQAKRRISNSLWLCGFHPGPSVAVKGSAEVGVEPGQGALDYIAAVLGAREHVTFVFVDYELGFYP